MAIDTVRFGRKLALAESPADKGVSLGAFSRRGFGLFFAHDWCISLLAKPSGGGAASSGRAPASIGRRGPTRQTS